MAEADFQGSTFTSNVNGSAGPLTINAVEKMPWFSTMRVRAGYPVGSVMPHVTGGAAWGERSIQGNVSDMGVFYADANFWTWMVGGGARHHQYRRALGRQPAPYRRQLPVLAVDWK